MEELVANPCKVWYGRGQLSDPPSDGESWLLHTGVLELVIGPGAHSVGG